MAKKYDREEQTKKTSTVIEKTLQNDEIRFFISSFLLLIENNDCLKFSDLMIFFFLQTSCYTTMRRKESSIFSAFFSLKNLVINDQKFLENGFDW